MRVLLVQKMAGVAGSETYYLNLLPALVGRGIDASFLIVERPSQAQLNDGFAARLESAGVKVIRRPCGKGLSWRLLREIAAVVREGRYDVVQSNLIHADLWLALVKRLFQPRMKLVSTKHGFSDSYQHRYGLDPTHIRATPMALATRFAARYANRVVTISNGLANLFAGGGLVDPNKIAVIPYGFTFANADSQLEPGEARFGSPQLVTVGRLVTVKQHDLLLRAFAGVLRDLPSAALVIVGGGPEEQRLKQLARDLGIERSVVWPGYVSNPHDYLRDSDLFVLTSAAEGFGAVVLEAWHNRLPVITFDVPALNEIITDGSDGILVPPFDQERLQERMVELLSDQSLAREIREKGRETYDRRYTIDAMTSATLDLYDDVLETPGERPRPASRIS